MATSWQSFTCISRNTTLELLSQRKWKETWPSCMVKDHVTRGPQLQPCFLQSRASWELSCFLSTPEFLLFQRGTWQMTAGTNGSGSKIPDVAFLQTPINIVAGLLNHKKKKSHCWGILILVFLGISKLSYYYIQNLVLKDVNDILYSF